MSRPLLWMLLLLWLVPECATAQGLDSANDRPHPELHWKERETEHFVLIYHEGLEEVAVRAATVAEQVYEPIARGMQVQPEGKFSILLSSEDQIINGFAVPRRMFLWVNQNDYLNIFGGSDKWLRGVLAHELQHNMWQEAARDWTGVFSLLRSPLWFVEGLAEYKTEEWGAARSDVVVRNAILQNRHTALDPHDSGFAKVRYLAEAYGDSVLVQAVKYRNWLGLADFHTGFRKATGITLTQFDEEWRRVATAYTYAVYSQKELIDEVGEFEPAPQARLAHLTYSPDGSQVAYVAQPPGRMPVLVAMENDSTKARTVLDHGGIGRNFAFNADGTKLVYAKFHRGDHGSLLWDLKVADLETGTTHWITQSRRANHPHWSAVGDRIVFIGIDGDTTNLYTCDAIGQEVHQLTQHEADVQVFDPRFSPDGQDIAYAKFERGRGLDLAILDVKSGASRYITRSLAHDRYPLWSREGDRLFFYSDRNADEVPNIYTVPARGHESQVEAVTDVGETMRPLAVDPATGDVIGRALASVDTMRLRRISPVRRTGRIDPVIPDRFTSWRDRTPDESIEPIDWDSPPTLSPPRTYRGLRRMTSLARFVLPSPAPWGVIGGALLSDMAGHHFLAMGVEAGTSDDTFKLRGAWANYETSSMPFGWPGFLTLFASLDGRTGFRIYDGELLLDRQDEVGVKWRQPLNFGEHLYANHSVELFARATNVDVEEASTFDEESLALRDLPVPLRNFDENTVGAVYRYTKRRPHPLENSHAVIGHGLLAAFERSDGAWGSDVDYSRLNLDGAKAIRSPFLGVPMFARARYEATWGSPPPQDFTGLRRDVPILPTDYHTALVASDLVEVNESFHLRGLPQNVVGTRALQTTLELRLSLTGKLPVDVFGWGLGGVTGVVFYDHGRVWGPAGEILARHTVGWEFRVPLTVFGQALVVPSYGEGQTLGWERDGAPFVKDEYFKIAMTQPF